MVAGPTGVGKTRFAIELALHLGAQIVGADSMQIFRHLNIGTAKPTVEELAAVRHHLVDCVDPESHFDAAEYGRLAGSVVRRLAAEGVVPLVVGGTGLYIKALIYGLFAVQPADTAVRERLCREGQELGTVGLHRRLAAADPCAAERIHVNDLLRIVRALEVIELTGRPVSDQQAEHGFRKPCFEALTIGLNLPREQLYQRIDQRVEAMLAAGLEEEVRRLLGAGFSPALKPMQALGYRHMTDYVQGRLDYAEMVRTLKRDHRRYAKRQLTWFRADPAVVWLAPDEMGRALKTANVFLNRGWPVGRDSDIL